MKTKALASVLALALVFSLFSAFSLSAAADVSYWDGKAATGFDAGDGSENDPYQIRNAGQLAYFLNQISRGTTYSGKFITLTDTILVNSPSMFEYDSRGSVSKVKTNVGMHMMPSGGDFKGIFNANGFCISGLYGAPLFSLVSTGLLMGLWISNSYMNSGAAIATKLGSGGTIYNCGSDATVWSDFTDYVGAIVAHNNGGQVLYCYNSGVVYGRNCVGGLVGYNSNNGVIYGGMNMGYVSGRLTAGGIAGFQDGESLINECFNYATITSDSSCGGIVAGNYYSYIYDSYNYGHIKGKSSSGGIAGKNTGYMESCYNVGVVDGEGSICGNADSSDTIVYCYYRNYSGAPTGCGIPLSESQMKNQDSFYGFDFDEVWVMNNENGYEYPQLQDTQNSTRVVLRGTLGISGEYKLGKNLYVDLSQIYPSYEFSESDVVWVIDGVEAVQGKSLNIKEEYLGKNILAYVLVSNNKHYCLAFSDSIVVTAPLDKVTISGKAEYGETLTAVTEPEEASVTYQWYSNGSIIANQTKKTYTLTSEDIGKDIYVVVKGTNGFTGEVESSAVTVAKGKIGSLSFLGRKQAQNTVTAILSKKDATAEYQWYLDDVAIEDATSASIKLTDEMVGKTVKLIAKGTGNYDEEVFESFVVKERILTIGDIDGNDLIELSDAILIFQNVAGKIELQGDALICADIDKNDSIELADAIKLFMFVAGKVTQL